MLSDELCCYIFRKTNRERHLIHECIQCVFVLAFTLNTATDLLSILELNESGNSLQLDQRMKTIRMVWISFVSLFLNKANKNSVVLLIFKEQINHRICSSTIEITRKPLTHSQDTYTITTPKKHLPRLPSSRIHVSSEYNA